MKFRLVLVLDIKCCKRFKKYLFNLFNLFKSFFVDWKISVESIL